MEHIDPQDLDAIALGDGRPTAEQRAHLDACPPCRAEVDAVRRTAGAIRSARDLAVSTPPGSVWSAIHAELGLDPALGASPRRGVLTDALHAEAGDAVEASPDPAGSSAAPATAGDSLASRRSHVAPRRSRSARRRWRVPALAAAVALVVGIGGGVGIAELLRANDDGAVVASARLAALPDWPDASGSATLRELPDGTREVDVDVDADADDTGLREVWLLTADATGLVSIGFLDGSSGTFRVPADVDLGAYPIVDVSAEPFDGDPTHSGDSIVRGELDVS